MRKVWQFAPLALMLLAFDPGRPAHPMLSGAVVTAPRIAFGISNDFKRDSLNRLYLNIGDTAVLSANTYNNAGQRIVTDKLVWLAENPKALAIKGVNQGQTITIVALQGDSVTRFKVTWTTYGVNAALTIRTKTPVSVAKDTTADRIAIEPNPIIVKQNDSVIVRVRAWNAQGIELFDKKNATINFDDPSGHHDLEFKPFQNNPQARWLVAGPCPLGVCSAAERKRGNVFLIQTARGFDWMVKDPMGQWRKPSGGE